jgi:hypothetical protein
MRPAIAVVLFLATFFSFLSLPAQTLEQFKPEKVLAGENALPQDVFRSMCELSAVRKAGNISRVRELEKILFEEMPGCSADDAPPAVTTGFHGPTNITSPLWGNDVRVYSGAIYAGVGALGGGTRQIRVCSDTVGGIYLGINRVYQDSASAISIYKSTNGGRNWSNVGSVSHSTVPIQSFDMCVTDTANGRWLISVAYVVKTDESLDGGGSLRWMSILDDGNHWRTTTISAANSGIGFRNPSICTDGAAYLPQATYHYVAAEYVSPSTDIARGLYIAQTTNRGASWGSPDTSLRAGNEGTPVIAVDCGANPDTIVVAYSRGSQPSRVIRIVRSVKILPFSWDLTVPSPQPGDNFDPSLAIDASRGNAMITYTRFSGSPHHQDVRSFRSSDLFETYSHDSIAVTDEYEGLSSVSFAPWSSGYYWRVAYRSTYNDGTIYYKSLLSKLSSWYVESPIAVNQFKPEYSIAPVVGSDRDSLGGQYRGNVAYVGDGPAGVYFDATDLTLNAPEEPRVPEVCSLSQNYPNPFNPTTTIGYTVGAVSGQQTAVSRVRLVVYDLLGREVAVLVDEKKEPGVYEVKFDGGNLSSGVYLYRMLAGSHVESKKFLLLR